MLKYLANIRIPTERAHGYAIMKMCEQFFDAGLAVELIVPGKKTNIVITDPFVYYHIKNNFPLIKVGGFDFLGLTEKFGHLFYWLDLISFVATLMIKSIIASDDIIYTRDFMLLLPFSRRRSICLEIHEIPKSHRLFIWQVFKAKKIVTLNNLLKQELVTLGISENKIMVASDAVDLADFQNSLTLAEARNKLSLPLDKKIVLYSGHFYKWKGVDVLAEAARILPEVLFIFVGGVEPDSQRFKAKFSKIGNIKIVPFQEHVLMPLYMTAADVLVLPNSGETEISSRYTSPLKLFEYMAARRPIVASDLPSIRETLNLNNSLLVKPDDSSALAEGINMALSGGRAIEEKVARAYLEVQNCTWAKRALKIKEFILS
jgi:glycosyltransferase involved in cell wall biosynthesis